MTGDLESSQSHHHLRWLPSKIREALERALSSPLFARLAHGMLWSFLGSVISRGGVVLSGIVAARLLGREVFGELGILQNTILMFGVFAGFGIGVTATKYISEFKIKDPLRAGRILSFSMFVAIISGLVATVLLAAFAWKLASSTLAAPHLAKPLRICSALFLLTAVNGAQTGILAGLEAFRKIAMANLLAGLGGLVLNTGAIVLFGFQGAIWGLVLASAFACIVNHLAIQAETDRLGIAVHWKPQFIEWRILTRFSLPAVLCGLVPGPLRWICNVMLVNKPNGYSEMGVFNAANQWAQVIIFFSTIIANASIPILSERLGANDRASSIRVLKATTLISAVLVVPLVAMGSLLSPWIMGAYGAGFRSNWPTLVVLLAASGVLAVQIPVGNLIQASGRMWMGAWMNWGSAVVLLALTHVALPLGALGLGLAVLGSYLAHSVWTFGYAGWIISKNSEAEVAKPIVR